MKSAGSEENPEEPSKQPWLRDCIAPIGSSEPQPALATESPALKPDIASRQATRILLAEDNHINREIALRQLKKLGFDADTAVDGDEVLVALQRASYDLILMDCQMPTLDGYEATARIRREHPRRIHIIAMTAHSSQGDRDKCLKTGMDDYVAKPVRINDLQAALSRWLQASVPLTRIS